jgi:hypothetical protein
MVVVTVVDNDPNLIHPPKSGTGKAGASEGCCTRKAATAGKYNKRVYLRW